MPSHPVAEIVIMCFPCDRETLIMAKEVTVQMMMVNDDDGLCVLFFNPALNFGGFIYLNFLALYFYCDQATIKHVNTCIVSPSTRMLSCFLKAAGFLYLVQCTIKYEGEESLFHKNRENWRVQRKHNYFGAILVNLIIFTYRLGKVSGNSL